MSIIFPTTLISTELSVTSNISDFDSATSRDWLLGPSSRLNVAILISVIFHAVVLFGITFKPPLPKIDNTATPLEVVLVNSKSASKPRNADALAQANLDGGGNTDSDRRAKTPLPVPTEYKRADEAATATQKTEQLEQEAKQLMTAIESGQDIYQAELSIRSSLNRIAAVLTLPIWFSAASKSLAWKRRLPGMMKLIKSVQNADSSVPVHRNIALPVMPKIGASKWSGSAT